MSRFGSDPLAFFRCVYREAAPWDIGEPQPAMAALLNDYPAEGPVLDVGCGSGDLAVHLAERGVETLGIDIVDEAIEQAQAKKHALPSEVAALLEFRVADALRPASLGQTFSAVVDSGFYHLFDPDQGEGYLNELSAVIRPSGRFYLQAFAVSFPVPNVPRAVSAEEVQERFTDANGWRILTLRSGDFLSRVAPVPATLACIEYIGSDEAWPR